MSCIKHSKIVLIYSHVINNILEDKLPTFSLVNIYMTKRCHLWKITT